MPPDLTTDSSSARPVFLSAIKLQSETDEAFYATLGEKGPWIVSFTLGDEKEIYIPALYKDIATEARVLLIKWPSVKKLKSVIDITISIMNETEIKSAIWYGTSVGGAIAQAANIYAPQYVRAMILSNTALPVSWAGLWTRIAVGITSLVPESFLRKKLGNAAQGQSVRDEADRVINLLSKSDVINWLRWAADFHNMKISKMKDRDRKKPVLLMETDNDPGVPKKYREKIKEFYETAEVLCFEGGGHFPQTLFPDQYTHAMTSFIRKLAMEP